MRVYFCGRFSQRQTFRWLRNALLAHHGMTVCSRWIDYEDTPLDERTRMLRGIEDMLDLQSADLLLYLCSPIPGKGGRFVELGLALAYGLRIVMVGEPEAHIFSSMPQVERVESLSHVMSYLGVQGREPWSMETWGLPC